MIVAWTLSSNPSNNYLECNGQAVDSSKYPKLYALMHNVPDYRGVFLRGLGGNSAALGALQGDAIRNITASTYTTSPPQAASFEWGRALRLTRQRLLRQNKKWIHLKQPLQATK